MGCIVQKRGCWVVEFFGDLDFLLIGERVAAHADDGELIAQVSALMLERTPVVFETEKSDKGQQDRQMIHPVR